MRGYTRRGFGVAAGAGLLSGCATVAAPKAALSPPTPGGVGPLRLAPVHVAESRVTRVVVGLRPFRPAGFVVRGESLGDKRLVHNYGHGGGGVTLSWGTAHLAVEQGFAGPDRDYAVLGCGAVGLATARLLQRRGGRVTLYARDLPPETTSNIAGGQWWPASVYDPDAVGPEFRGQLSRAAALAYREYQSLIGPTYGVRWIRNYRLSERPIRAGEVTRALRDMAPEMRDLAPGEHPFGAAHVQQYDTMLVEPHIYLQAMMEDVLTAGGRIVVREFRTRNDVAALSEPVVFNCTGLGAGALFGDPDIVPVRGQLVVLLPQPEVNYIVLANEAYMFPRSDGIILGGSFDQGDWRLEPDAVLTQRILDDHRRLFGAMRST